MGEVFSQIKNGKSIKQTKDKKGIPITRIETIWNGKIDPEKFGYAGIESPSGYEDSLLKKGDILMSHINSLKHLGKSASYKGSPNVLIHGMNLLRLRPKKEIILPQYAEYFFKSKQFYTQVLAISNQSVNQCSFSATKLKSLQIPLPPLSEQRRLAARLDQADAVRQKSRALVEAYAELGRSVFLEVFGDPVRNERGWEVVALGEISEISSGSTPSRSNPDYWENGTIPWVKTGEVRGTEINETEEKITNKGLEESSCKLYPKGSIIIAMYGQGKTRGRVGKLGIEATTNQACAVIMPKNKRVHPDFLFNFLDQSYETLRNLGRGGNQPNLNSKIIKEFQIPLPPLPLQARFAAMVANIEAQRRLAERQLAAAEAVFGGVLQGTFEG